SCTSEVCGSNAWNVPVFRECRKAGHYRSLAVAARRTGLPACPRAKRALCDGQARRPVLPRCASSQNHPIRGHSDSRLLTPVFCLFHAPLRPNHPGQRLSPVPGTASHCQNHPSLVWRIGRGLDHLPPFFPDRITAWIPVCACAFPVSETPGADGGPYRTACHDRAHSAHLSNRELAASSFAT